MKSERRIEISIKNSLHNLLNPDLIITIHPMNQSENIAQEDDDGTIQDESNDLSTAYYYPL